MTMAMGKGFRNVAKTQATSRNAVAGARR